MATRQALFWSGNSVTSTGSDPSSTNGSVQTTNATQTTLAAATLVDNTAYWVQARIIGRDATTGADVATFVVHAYAYRSGGGAVLQATPSVITTGSTAGATTWLGTFTASGNDVRVSVTGALATTVDWVCSLEWQSVSA